VKKMQDNLRPQDFTDFSKFNDKMIQYIETVLSLDLMKMVAPPSAEVSNNPFSQPVWVVSGRKAKI